MLVSENLVEIDLELSSGHDPDAGLRHGAEVVVAMVGDVGGLDVEVVSLGVPLQLGIEHGVGTVGNELAVRHVAAHAFLPAEIPAHGEPADNAVRQARHEFMPEILHCNVALDYLLGIVFRLVYVSVAYAEGTHPGVAPEKLRQEKLSAKLHAQIVEVEGCGVVDVVGRIHHPVYHLSPAVIEAFHARLHPAAPVLCCERQRMVVFGLQVAVPFVRGALVVEFREGGQAEALVVGEQHLPSGRWAPGDVDAGIQAEAVVDAGGHACHQAGREGPMAEQDIMFEAEGDRRAVIAAGIDVACAFGGCVLPQVRTQDVLVTQECRDSRLAEGPGDVSAGLEAIDVCAVEVLAEGSAADKLEVVVGALPEELRGEVEAPLRLGADAGHEPTVALVLVGIGGAVEGVGSVALLREAELPVEPQRVVLVVALIEELSLLPGAVGCAAVAPAAAAADAVVCAPQRKGDSCFAFAGAVGATPSCQVDALLAVVARNNVDGAAEALSAIDATGRSLEHFDALDVADADGEVC